MACFTFLSYKTLHRSCYEFTDWQMSTVDSDMLQNVYGHNAKKSSSPDPHAVSMSMTYFCEIR